MERCWRWRLLCGTGAERRSSRRGGSEYQTVLCWRRKFIATYSTQIRALEIKRILGHDPRSRNWKLLPQSTREIYEKNQRVTSKDRREGVAAYIEQRLGPRNMVGAFPAISIGVTHRPKFDPFPNNAAIGVLHLEEEVERIILDGLGRVSGCMDLADESAEGKDLVRSIVLPVTFSMCRHRIPNR
jgi:hypothetical protein